jgi:hypothetical protein
MSRKEYETTFKMPWRDVQLGADSFHYGSSKYDMILVATPLQMSAYGAAKITDIQVISQLYHLRSLLEYTVKR